MKNGTLFICFTFYVISLQTKTTHLTPTKPGEMIVVIQHAMRNEKAVEGNWWSYSLGERENVGGTVRCTFEVNEHLPQDHLHKLKRAITFSRGEHWLMNGAEDRFISVQ